MQNINKDIENVCNHNYNDSLNTLVGVPILKMTYPIKYCLRCKECDNIIYVNKSDINDVENFLHMFFK